LSSQDRPKKKKKWKNAKQRTFEEKYGGDDLPRSRGRDGSQRNRGKEKGAGNSGQHSRFVDEPVEKKKKKGKKNFKEKKAAFAAQYAADWRGDNGQRQRKKDKKRQQSTGKNYTGSSHFKSKWVPSEKGNWTYKGKVKKEEGTCSYGGRKDWKAGGNSGNKGFKSEKGLNFKFS
jgi:hypothetical protein